jgi:hypothetical protein
MVILAVDAAVPRHEMKLLFVLPLLAVLSLLQFEDVAASDRPVITLKNCLPGTSAIWNWEPGASSAELIFEFSGNQAKASDSDMSGFAFQSCEFEVSRSCHRHSAAAQSRVAVCV